MDLSPISIAIVTGVGATMLMDLAMTLRRLVFDIATPDYALVGRWIAYMPRGRFRHRLPIGAVAPARRERLIGWLAHYAIGISFAALLLITCGLDWARHPTPGPALVVGLVTVFAPFLIMQPGMGAGFFASHTRHPSAARLQTLTTHAVFGLALYVAAWLARFCGVT
jgi:hypothetical protein